MELIEKGKVKQKEETEKNASERWKCVRSISTLNHDIYPLQFSRSKAYMKALQKQAIKNNWRYAYQSRHN